MFGNWNRILHCDLTAAKTRIVDQASDIWRMDVGGSAMGTRILYEEKVSSDPLRPDAVLVFATGPWQGTALPGSAKFSVCGRSPMSKTFAVTTAGAGWGVRFKRTGHDALTITGRSEVPAYLEITDEATKIKSATHLWGKDAITTCKLLAADKQTSVAAIGPAGENQVAAACIVVDGHSFAGRCGLGAVMGSKNLKAIVVRGKKQVPLSAPDTVSAIQKREAKRLSAINKDTFTAHGTAGTLADCEAIGDLPIANWSGDVWPQAQYISAPHLTTVLNAKPWPCMHCPIGCHRRIHTSSDAEYSVIGAGPEYESLAMLGSNALIDDVVVLARANELCNEMGLDTISTGAWAGFLMDCVHNGLASENDFGTEPATWGNGRFLLEFIEQVAYRRHAGALFATGIRPAAEKLSATHLAVEVKNVDFPAHDPRTYFSLAVNYATSTRGACHLRGFPHCGEAGMLIPEAGYDTVSERFTMTGKAALAKLFQDYSTALDSLVCCCFMQITGMSLSATVEALRAITGWDMGSEELLRVGERAFVKQRVINLRDGVTGADDRLPDKMYVAASEGPRTGKTPDLTQALPEYYNARGFDDRGVPTAETLGRLGISQAYQG